MMRKSGVSVRLKLTVSYAVVLALTSIFLLAAVWVFLLQYIPRRAFIDLGGSPLTDGVFPVRSNLVHVFVPRAAAMLGILLMVGLVGAWFLSGVMLSPLARITDATRVAATGSLSHRIRLRGRRDEFRELADSFDAMLARLEAHDAEQQRFAANASHELRTPLAVTQTLLDVAENDPRCDIAELTGRLRDVNTRAIELTEALLLLSRTGRRSLTPQRVDLSLAVEEAIEDLLPLAEKRGVTVEASGTAAFTAGSRPLLIQLATNLIHNAIVHNLPENGAVRVTTEVASGWAVLTIENTGETLDPQVVETLTEPFRRGTERVRNDHAGVGLGLAIVKNIAENHDGTLALSAREEGGLRAVVRLPAMSDDADQWHPAAVSDDRSGGPGVQWGVGPLLPRRNGRPEGRSNSRGDPLIPPADPVPGRPSE